MGSAGGAPGMRHSIRLGILALLVLHLSMAALATRGVRVASSFQHEGVVLRIDSTASKHFMSEISLFHSSVESDANVSFSTVAGTMITSRAVGTVKFKAADDGGDFRTITLDHVYLVPQQQHNLAAVCKLTHCAVSTLESLDFKTCTWQDDGHTEFVWNALALSEFGETTRGGIVVPKSLDTTRSQGLLQPVEDNIVLRPSGNKNSAQ